MEKAKRVAKKVLPGSAKQRVGNLYHLGVAVAANVRYGQPSKGMKVVMITGTNGKTTTAAMLASILRAAGLKVGVISTAFFEINGKQFINDQNATAIHPMLLQQKLAEMKKHGIDVLILEVTSHALMQYRVWGIPCEVAIMTNLTQDHLDYHGSMEKYAAAKAKLFKRKPRFIVLNHDDEWFDYYDQFPPGEQTITYGTHPDADARLVGARMHRQGSRASVEIDHTNKLDLVLHMPGKFNVYNALAAASAAYVLHVKTKDIEAGIEAIEGVPGRQQKVEAGQPFEVIIDYAHTPDAFTQLLGSLRQLNKKKIHLVFGATGDRDKTKRAIMGGIAAEYADRLYLTDEENYTEDAATIRTMVMEGISKAGAEERTQEIPDRREAIAAALATARRGDMVVITGMGHEQFRIINGEKVPWNDADVVRELLEK
ncbi:UDP-N-acetylmuramoyl-L-alanyl-D-glutamate--2,6-diaminopimelate ligase [Candidatus Saccharibacteria bacterium]|nr:UDP-N-acetylmuramoyl-L-alanyl-D-glutamate--2,6-diaminopimelate ligase [Candidatus Saccharibacteria bacterium]